MLTLPIPLLLTISVITSAAYSMACGGYTKMFGGQSVNIWRFTFLSNISSLCTIAIVSLTSNMCLRFSLFSTYFGLLMALAVILSLYFKLLAQSSGSFAYTSVISALNAVIPISAGLLFFDEKVTAIQCSGLVFMALCIYLSNEKENGKAVFNFKWLGYCAIMFVTSGAQGTIQKFHQRSAIHKEEIPAMLIICFLAATVLSGMFFLRENRKTPEVSESNNNKMLNMFPAISGVALAFPHMLNLFLSGKIESIIFFPVVNLTPLILVMIMSVLILKEKLSIRRWIGIALGIISTIFFSGIIKI